jgi:hypothetical protein
VLFLSFVSYQWCCFALRARTALAFARGVGNRGARLLVYLFGFFPFKRKEVQGRETAKKLLVTSRVCGEWMLCTMPLVSCLSAKRDDSRAYAQNSIHNHLNLEDTMVFEKDTPSEKSFCSPDSRSLAGPVAV